MEPQKGSSEFLNPKAMVTPGVAGALTMAITNTVATRLAAVDSPSPWVPRIALVISFLFGLLAIGDDSIVRWKRLTFYIVNSLIIFTVAVGSNTVGGAVSAAPPQTFAALSVAQAQPTPPTGWCCLNRQVSASSEELCSQRGGNFFTSRDEAARACSQRRRSFFRDWFGGG